MLSYQADYVDADGKRHRRVLAGDRHTAERVLTKLVRDRDLQAAGLGGEQGLDLPVSFLVEQYLADLRTRARPRTIANSTASLGRMCSRASLVLVRHVTRERLSGWRLARVKDGVSNKTINTELGALLAALNLSVRLGQLAHNPLDGLRALPITARHQRRRPRALSEEELVRLLEAAGRDDAAHPSQVPRGTLLRALIVTGARWNELVSTTWADFDQALGTLTLRAETTKTQVARTIPLDEGLLAELGKRTGPPDERIFLTPRGRPWKQDTSNFRRWLCHVLAISGVARLDASGRIVHIHALRHTFATRLARAGIPLAVAQALTGHRSVQLLVSVYSHVTTDDAREAIRRLPRILPAGSFLSAGSPRGGTCRSGENDDLDGTVGDTGVRSSVGRATGF